MILGYLHTPMGIPMVIQQINLFQLHLFVIYLNEYNSFKQEVIYDDNYTAVGDRLQYGFIIL